LAICRGFAAPSIRIRPNSGSATLDESHFIARGVELHLVHERLHQNQAASTILRQAGRIAGRGNGRRHVESGAFVANHKPSFVAVDAQIDETLTFTENVVSMPTAVISETLPMTESVSAHPTGVLGDTLTFTESVQVFIGTAPGGGGGDDDDDGGPGAGSIDRSVNLGGSGIDREVDL
jgi:hypothetical protein